VVVDGDVGVEVTIQEWTDADSTTVAPLIGIRLPDPLASSKDLPTLYQAYTWVLWMEDKA